MSIIKTLTIGLALFTLAPVPFSFAAKKNGKSCESLLEVEHKLSRGLRDQLKTIGNQKRIKAFLLIDETDDGTLSGLLKKNSFFLLTQELSTLDVEIEDTDYTVGKKRFILVNASKKALLEALKLDSVEWAGLRRRKLVDPVKNPSPTVTPKELEEAKEQFSQQYWTENSDITSIGTGDKVIRVIVLSQAAADRLPKTYKGIAIEAVVSGPIVAQKTPTPPVVDEGPKQNVMFQLKLTKESLTLEQAKAALKEAGVELDESFPATWLGKEDLYVLRGWVTEGSMKRAQEKLKEVQFFSNPKIGPFGGIGTFGPVQSKVSAEPASRYILVFKDQESFEKAKPELQRLGVTIDDNFTGRSSGKVRMQITTTEAVFEKIKALPTVYMAEKVVYHYPSSPQEQPSPGQNTGNQIGGKLNEYTLTFDNQASADEALAKFKELGISVVTTMKQGNRTSFVTVIIKTDDTSFEQAKKLKGIQSAQKYSDDKLTDEDRALVPSTGIKPEDPDQIARKKRADDLRKQVDELISGNADPNRPKSPRELTDEAARKAKEEANTLPQGARPTGGLAPISISDVPREVLTALANPDRNSEITLSLTFNNKADFDLFQEVLRNTTGIKDKLLVDDEAPFLGTIKGSVEVLGDLLSRLSESNPGAVRVRIPAPRKQASGTDSDNPYELARNAARLLRKQLVDALGEKAGEYPIATSLSFMRDKNGLPMIALRLERPLPDEIKIPSEFNGFRIETAFMGPGEIQPATVSVKQRYNLVIAAEFGGDRIFEVADRLKEIGVDVVKAMKGVGILTVEFDPAKIEEVKKVLGVKFISPNRINRTQENKSSTSASSANVDAIKQAITKIISDSGYMVDNVEVRNDTIIVKAIWTRKALLTHRQGPPATFTYEGKEFKVVLDRIGSQG